MTEGPVPNVVQKDRDVERGLFFRTDVDTLELEHQNRALHDMHAAQRMMETRVVRPGVHKVRHSHLGYAPQALEIRMLDKVIHQRVSYGNEPVNWVVEDFQLIDLAHNSR
jgi:hypothetical protein